MRKLPSTARGRRRMLTLATLLEADAKNKKGLRFDLGTWGYGVDRSMGVDCGTRACAMGLAALSGKFKRAGLTYKIRHNSDFFGDSTNLVVVMLGGREGFSAAQKLFDLSRDEAEWLFAKNFYALYSGKSAELAVAKRLRGFATGRQKFISAAIH